MDYKNNEKKFHFDKKEEKNFHFELTQKHRMTDIFDVKIMMMSGSE